jgi:putative flippase GtrA
VSVTLESNGPEPNSSRPDHTPPPSRLRALITRLFKFGLVGGTSYIIDAGLWVVLVNWTRLMSNNGTTASIITGLIATVYAWIGNRYWTFSERKNANKVGEFIAFFVVNIIGIGVTSATYYVATYWMDFTSEGAQFVSRNIIGIGLGTVVRFLCYHFFIFTADEEGNAKKWFRTKKAASPADDTDTITGDTPPTPEA